MARAADVVMLLSNPLVNDTRVKYEARALMDEGWRVLVLCWDREGWLAPGTREVDGVPVRVLRAAGSYGGGLRQLVGFAVFWTWLLWRVLLARPRAVHANDLDTLPPGYAGGRLVGAKVVYDSHENYPVVMQQRASRRIAGLAERMERLLLPHVDHVFTVTPVIADILRGRGARDPEVLFNCKPLSEYRLPEEERRRVRREELRVPDGACLFLYVGGLAPHRRVLEVAEAVERAGEKAWFVAAGYGALEGALRATAERCPRIRFLGRVPNEKVAPYTAACDVVVVINDPSSLNSVQSIPNKFFEAVAAGRPLLASGEGFVGRMVREWGCGLVVVSDDDRDIAAKVLQLAGDGELRERLARSAEAASRRLNWEAESAKLTGAYARLLGREDASAA